MSETKRSNIKKRIEAGEARNAERAKTIGEHASEARDQAVDFAKAHPIALIAGALALGVAISALFPRSPTRKAGKQIGSKAASLAALAAEFAILYGEKVMEAAQDAGRAGLDRIEDFGDAAGDRARSLRREANHLAESASDGAKSLSRAVRDRLN